MASPGARAGSCASTLWWRSTEEPRARFGCRTHYADDDDLVGCRDIVRFRDEFGESLLCSRPRRGTLSGGTLARRSVASGPSSVRC